MSYIGKDLPLMAPDESSALGFDFTKKFATTAATAGETISSAVWSLVAYQGTDAGASGHIGATTITGLIAGVIASGLLDGVTYRLRCVATSSLGNIRSYHSFITCKAPLDAET